MKFSGYGYEMEELREKFEGEGIKVDAELKIQNRKISGLATPEDIADAVTLGYANNNYMNKSTDNIISGDNTFSGENTFTGDTIFSNTITGDISGNAETVTNGVYTTGDQTIGGNKTFSNTITGDISGNAETVTNGVYTTGDQTIGGNKTFSNTITGDISGNAGTVTDGVYTTGDQTIGGTKTFSNIISGDISGNAGTVTNGVYTTGNQTIAGIKTFSDSIAVDTVSEGAGADGVTIDGVTLKDGGGTFTGNVGIGTNTPGKKLDIYDLDDTVYSNSPGNILNIRNTSVANNTFAGISMIAVGSGASVGVSSILAQVTGNGSADTVFTNRNNGSYIETMRITSDGIINIPKQSSADIEKSSAQNLSNTTGATITNFTSTLDNTNVTLNTTNGTITIDEAGTYFVSAVVAFDTSSTGGRMVQIRKNGSATNLIQRVQAIPTYGTYINVSGIVKCSVDDVLNVQATQYSGGDLDVSFAKFQVVKIK